MTVKHYSSLNVYERDALVEKMTLKHVHVQSLRKRLKSKIRKRHLRGALLLHICTFILIALYLQELVSNQYLLSANQDMLTYIEHSSFSDTTSSGHNISKDIQHIGDVNDLELWMKKFVLQKLLIDSKPLYYNLDNPSGSSTTPSTSTTISSTETTITTTNNNTNSSKLSTEIATREFHGKYLLLWGVRIRQIRVKPINRTANNQLLEHACLVHRKTNENFYDIDFATSPFGEKTYGWLKSACYPEWSNVLSSFIESDSDEYKPNTNVNDIQNEFNYTYFDASSDPSSTKADVNYQQTFYNSYPNRGWSSIFLVGDDDIMLKFNQTIDHSKFVDEQTRVLLVEFTSYLPTTGIFTNVRIIFELPISGGILHTPVVTSSQFDGFATVSFTRIVSGAILTVINIYNIARGLKDLIKSCKGNGDFIIYTWDVIEIINEMLMMMLVFDLWNELFIESDFKNMKNLLLQKGTFVDTTSLITKRRSDIRKSSPHPETLWY